MAIFSFQKKAPFGALQMSGHADRKKFAREISHSDNR